MRVFSNRYLKAIYDKKLIVMVPSRLRRRIWILMQAHNATVGVQRDPGDRWITDSSVTEETLESLRSAYGDDKLQARTSGGERGPVDNLHDFVSGCYPSQVLDTVEAFWHHLGGYAESTASFERAINEAFEDETCPWRMDSGEFFKIDETFLGMRLAETAEQGLQTKSFRGAHNEFREARQDLLAGDSKGCISNAQKAFESALKTLLGTDSGNASNLIRQLASSGKLNDLPPEFRAAFGEQVLMCLPTMGNRLGRHGQGRDVVAVPSVYARLTLELAAAYLNFLVTLAPAPAPPSQESNVTEEVSFSVNE
jgi:hypothetical protein